VVAEGGDRRVLLGLIREAVTDDFWLGEPAHALLAFQSEEVVAALVTFLLLLAGALDEEADNVLVAPSLAPGAVARASPEGFLAMCDLPLFQALAAAMEEHRRYRGPSSGKESPGRERG
jgi:hypothetical protein